MMKKIKHKAQSAIAFGVLALLPYAAIAQTASSPVVGYTTETLSQGFNYIGLTLHNPVIVSGAIDGVATTTLTENDVTLNDVSVLGVSEVDKYILEITSGVAAGTTQEITSWTANTIVTPLDFAALGLVSTDTYQIRKTATISDIFGANNEAGLAPSTDFTTTNADVIYIPQSSGGFIQYFYSTLTGLEGWRDTSGNDAAESKIAYVDSLIIKKITAGELIITGEVKTDVTVLSLGGSGRFNYLGSVYPEGSTLGNSNLAAVLTPSDDFTTTNADVVYLPNGSGFTQYFYSTLTGLEGWRDTSGNLAEDIPLTASMIIQRKGTDIDATLTPSTDISNL